MSDENSILGYRADGSPIENRQPGFFYTAALIICHHCNGTISGSGGPAHGSTCASCWDKGYRYHGNE
ncbi:hypothetical protein HYP93_gp28 [Stenotrophomonas phage Pokken]|uniref:Uncharacterized protein n=1 Tax=Stenotrophomonas phage Pokken TaxID=2596674 RepID=A0A5B9NCP4_9CAUD|nr:hypothetical protein HYP93_gp28 [Stenotrophomonas phage Pokken]QEG09251.1 hypothetical protein CPT_Pokken_028 [Stenotrophomonas phage Pokken]